MRKLTLSQDISTVNSFIFLITNYYSDLYNICINILSMITLSLHMKLKSCSILNMSNDN